MTPPASPAGRRPDRRARFAVAAMFLTNGAIFANLLPRYPQIKAELGLSNAAMGAAVAGFPLGALLAGLTAGALIQRFRSSRVSVAGTLVMAVAILLATLAPSWAALAGALFLAGAMDAVVDVAQNAHGLRVQRLYGRSILNSFHAAWSAGAVLGGLMGSAAAGVQAPLAVHLGISGMVFGAIALASYRFMLPGPESEGRGTRAVDVERAPPTDATAGAAPDGPAGRSGRRLPPRTVGVLLALGVIGACGGVTEDAGASWGAIYLTGSLGAAAGAAGLAFVALQGMQFIGRILGDRLTDRFGQRAVARGGGVITATGMGLALAVPTTVTTIAGFGLAGLGVATLIPAAMHAADELPGLSAGIGLTAVTWLMRVGFLLSPPLVGVVADAVSLRLGLLLVPAAGVAVVVLARYLPRREAGVPPHLLPS